MHTFFYKNKVYKNIRLQRFKSLRFNIYGPRHAFSSEGTNKLKLFLEKMSPSMVVRRKTIWVLEARFLKINLGQDFLHSFGNDTKLDLYVDEMEISIPLIKDQKISK